MRKRIIPLIVAVLCLVSMMVPVIAMTSSTNSGVCQYCGGTMGAVECNDWYNFTHYYYERGKCYATWNDRCIQTCEDCGKRIFVSHCHSVIYDHNMIEENPDDDVWVCSNGTCAFTIPNSEMTG